MPLNEDLIEEEYVQVGAESRPQTPNLADNLEINTDSPIDNTRKSPKLNAFLANYYNTTTIYPTPSNTPQVETANLQTSITDKDEPQQVALIEEVNSTNEPHIPTTFSAFLDDISNTLASGWNDLLEGVGNVAEQFKKFSLEQASDETENGLISLATAHIIEEEQQKIGSDTPENEAKQAILDICKTAAINHAMHEKDFAIKNLEIAAIATGVEITAKKMEDLSKVEPKAAPKERKKKNRNKHKPF